MGFTRRVVALVKRCFRRKITSKFAVLPMTKMIHPVFRTHYQFLQDRTALPRPGKILHVINRLPQKLVGYHYIAEVEGLHSVLPKSITRASDFDEVATLPLIEDLIRSQGLKAIVFQSESAEKRNKPYITEFISKFTYVVTAVPPRIVPRIFETSNEVKILLIGTTYIRKGFFLLEPLIAKVKRHRQDISFTLVCSEPISDLGCLTGLKTIVQQRLTQDQRDELFKEHHYLLNLSVGDTLGTFLDSIEYNLPIIGFPGQHGKSYVKKEFGFLVESPIFEYSVDRHWNMKSFEKVVLNYFREGRFNDCLNDLTSIILKLDITENYNQILQKQLEFSLRNFSVEKFLLDWRLLYEKIESNEM